MSHVVIIGGGFAGLSAGVALSRQGVRLTLIEQRRHLGGRAYSFTDRTTGDTVDNGQHLLMKCYHHTRDFLTHIGTIDRLRFQDRFHIDFHHPLKGLTPLTFPPTLPPPLHLLVGFLRFGPINTKDALGLHRLAEPLKSPPPTDYTVDDLLNRCGQSERIRQAFWDPLCISALNQPPASAPASHLIAILREALSDERDAAYLGYPGVGLSTLYTDASESFIKSRGGRVRIGIAATGLDISPGGPINIRLKSADPLTADAVICATTPPAQARLLPDTLAGLKQQLLAFRPWPILSVNLWFDRPIITSKFIGLLGAQMDWIFNKSALYENRDKASEGHITLVASAADRLVGKSDDELVAIALRDLRSRVPSTAGATLRHHRVVRERQATFALPPGQTHPTNHTSPLPNLFLAGDWTDTGLPSTIESAVISGYRAAESVRQFLAGNA